MVVRKQSALVLGLLITLLVFSTYSIRTSWFLEEDRIPETVAFTHEQAHNETEFRILPPSSPQQSDSSPSIQTISPPQTDLDQYSETEQPPELPTESEIGNDVGTKPKHKPEQIHDLPEIVDNFPLAVAAQSASDLPSIPPWNKPPSPHVPEKTPLFIGFTRNWRLLQQAVVSYITAGWPPEDIYIIENTGTMRSNELGLLSLQNPFFLNHTRLHLFGVNIITTPTLLSFSQLQNFYIWTSIQKNFTTYFYSHMDVIVLPYEHQYTDSGSEYGTPNTFGGFKSVYGRAVDTLRLATSLGPDPNASNSSKPWAARFFSYDRLALVNREAYESIGGWDTQIPYYFSDCDMHDRLKMYQFEYNGPDIEIGDFHDVAGSLDDLLVLYRKRDSVEPSFIVDGPEDEARESKRNLANISTRSNRSWVSDDMGSVSFEKLSTTASRIAQDKASRGLDGRNTWQARQAGGKGEPYYRDPAGFEKGIQMLTQTGREVYAEKWGHRSCDLLPFGYKAGDEWRVEHDWE